MTPRIEVIEKLKRQPRDVTWNEIARRLEGVGDSEPKRGETGGARRRFGHETAAMIAVHRPHPANKSEGHQVELVLATLSQEALIGTT